MAITNESGRKSREIPLISQRLSLVQMQMIKLNALKWTCIMIMSNRIPGPSLYHFSKMQFKKKESKTYIIVDRERYFTNALKPKIHKQDILFCLDHNENFLEPEKSIY